MKSFADWTQDIADRVGDVQHHWETNKETELKASDSFEEHSWAVPGQAPVPPPPSAPLPDPSMTQPIDTCDDCGLVYTRINMQVANTGSYGAPCFKLLCRQCLINRGIQP